MSAFHLNPDLSPDELWAEIDRRRAYVGDTLRYLRNHVADDDSWDNPLGGVISLISSSFSELQELIEQAQPTRQVSDNGENEVES